MDDTADEKKALEAELEVQDEKLPDPEENLILSLGGGRAWSVKVGLTPQTGASAPGPFNSPITDTQIPNGTMVKHH